MTLPKDAHVHFIGIGGIGMSGVAQVLHARGYRVSGTDLRESKMTRRLSAMGIGVSIGHTAERIRGADVVVYSSAVSADNPEYVAALEHGVPLLQRAEMLGRLLDGKTSIVVTGTHGKTTTTSMIAAILERAGLEPTSIIGGELEIIGGNARHGAGTLVVAEGDESDGSFVHLRPTIALVNNIDADHLDYYRNLDAVTESFSRFLEGVAEDGLVLLSADCPRTRGLAEGRSQRVVLYGLSHDADLTAYDVDVRREGTRFTVREHGEELGRVDLRLAGLHNVHNALGAIGAARSLGVPFERMVDVLAELEGPCRRFELLGEASGVSVIDDYAHHPVEIEATLSAFRQRYPGRRIGVFQPHRYSRTMKLLPQFGSVFNSLDTVILTDVYAAGEDPIPGIDGMALYECVRRSAKHTIYVDRLDDISACILNLVQPGDALITMGAGDVWKVGQAVLTGLGERVD